MSPVTNKDLQLGLGRYFLKSVGVEGSLEINVSGISLKNLLNSFAISMLWTRGVLFNDMKVVFLLEDNFPFLAKIYYLSLKYLIYIFPYQFGIRFYAIKFVCEKFIFSCS